MRVLLLVAALLGLAYCSSSEEHYRGHKLLAAWPQDEAQVELLRAVGQWREVDLFTHHVMAGRKVAMMVPPNSVSAVQKVLADKGVRFNIEINDVQGSVDAEKQRQQENVPSGRASRTVPSYERYMRYAEIQEFLKETAKTYPSLATLHSAGKSYEGRDMTALLISKTGGKSERAIIVDAGIHAREWIAPPVAIYLIQQLTQDAAANSALLDGVDWYILPLVNPDGYEYTHTRERFWRKNRSAKNSRWCPGTDLNRNFGFHYRQSGASDYPCDETYAGPKAFSEIEAQNLANWITKSNSKKNVKMYLTLHSYGPEILYPWGYDKDLPDAEDKDELVSIAEEVNSAIVKAGSEGFKIENSAGLYPAAGASDDWAKGVAGIAKAYTIELQGGGSLGFDLPANRILPVVQQLFEGFKVFAARAKKL